MTGGGCSQWRCLLLLAHGTPCSSFCSLYHLHHSDQQLNPFSLHGFDRVGCFISPRMECTIKKKKNNAKLFCYNASKNWTILSLKKIVIYFQTQFHGCCLSLCFVSFSFLFFIVNPWKYRNIICAKKTRVGLIEFDPFVQSMLYWIPVYEHWKQVFSLPMFDKFVQWKEGSADWSQAIYVLWMWFIDK